MTLIIFISSSSYSTSTIKIGELNKIMNKNIKKHHYEIGDDFF